MTFIRREIIRMKTKSFSCSNRNGALPIQLMFVAWLIVAVLAGCQSANETPQNAVPPSPMPIEKTPAPSPTQQAVKKKSAVRLPRVEAALKKSVAARLNSWKASIVTRDLEKHLQYYADQVETYYLASNVNRDFIRADREQAFKKFDQLKLEIINVDINLEENDAATITFDKSWDFTKGASFSNGLVQQEIQMRKIEKQWFIVSEKDLQIYRSRNNQ